MLIRIAAIAVLVFLTHTSATGQVPGNLPSSGLMGWWPFNGNANDESGNGNNGTVSGASPAADRFGVAGASYAFNGETDYITIRHTDHFDFLRSGSFTVNFFMRGLSSITSGQEADNEIALSLGDFCEQYQNRGLLAGITSPNMLWYAVRGDKGYDYTSNCMIDNRHLGSWQMITLVRDYGKHTRLYVNGVLAVEVQDIAGETRPHSETRNIEVGRLLNPCGGDSNHHFNGDIDDIGMWNRVLGDDEIRLLYDCQEPVLVESHVFNVRENATWKSKKLRRGATYIVEGYGQWKANSGSMSTEEDFCYTYPLPCVPSQGNINMTMRVGYDLDDMLANTNLIYPRESTVNCDDHTYHYYLKGDDRELILDFRDSPASDNAGELGVRIYECLSCSASQPSDSILGYRSVETHQVVTYALRNNPAQSYQWIATGGYLLGETTNHFCDVIWGYDEGGSVCCIVSDSTCTDTICVDVAIRSVTTGGIAGEDPIDATMSVRPNPTSDMIEVSSVNASDATSYSLLDVTGRVLQQAHGQRVRMSVENVPSGVYHMVMRDGTGLVIAIERVVVQR